MYCFLLLISKYGAQSPFIPDLLLLKVMSSNPSLSKFTPAPPCSLMSGSRVAGGKERGPTAFSPAHSSSLHSSLAGQLCGLSGGCLSHSMGLQRQLWPRVSPPRPMGTVSVIGEVNVTSMRVGKCSWHKPLGLQSSMSCF